ncbi:organic cation transporter protein-like [Patiria miniata]|uniref:Major facilitator superfamily (MFS) profile domain-containing protein n=1 Tax=Patiria miniata TaxID=46514 RepID=A0A913YX88_PATMI|nr:organic cation transporter protein-like [Patiria miniata]
MDVDASLRVVGLVGRVQIANFVIFGMGLSLSAIQLTGIAFTVDQSVAHHCKPAPGSLANETMVYVEKDGREVPDGCYMYDVDNGTFPEDTTICKYGWEYAPEYGEKSATTDFDLVCDRGYLANLLMSCHFAGFLVGGFITGQAADMFGRRVVSMATLLLMSVLGTAISFTWNLKLLMALRFILGVVIPGNSLVGYIRAVEMFTPKKRLLGHVFIQHFWSFGVILVAPLAYLFPNWRYFQLFTSLICLPVHVIMWFFTYESLRWLVQKGWFEKADAILRKIAKSKNIKHNGSFLIQRELEAVRLVGKMELSEKSNHDRASDLQHESVTADVEENNQEPMNKEKMESFTQPDENGQTQSKKKKKYTVLDLFKTKVLIKHTCIVFCLWYVMNTTYNGFIVYATSLAGNKYLNFFLLALAETPAYSTDFFIVRRFGRKRPLIVFFFTGAVACLLIAFLPSKTANGTDFTVIIVIVAMIGKFYANATYEVTMLMGAEIFPTMLRNIATGSASTVGGISGIIAPFIVYLQEVRSFLPMLVIGCMSLVACSLVFMLPETKNKPLPETYEDASKLSKD